MPLGYSEPCRSDQWKMLVDSGHRLSLRYEQERSDLDLAKPTVTFGVGSAGLRYDRWLQIK